jgi:alkanesulfonate monooxygenase SsuD/methylene tetrahydromethanopterin reductase-like flavin-dependent oxidoreductase (luciferase family)
MVTLGVHCQGFLECPLEKLDNGYVVPDVPLSQVHEFHRRALETQIEIAVAADEFGYDYAVHPENHFDLVLENSPDPVLTQMAVAARTDDIRLLQAANSLPRRDPLRLAERTAMLDVVSDGRVDVGIATGAGGRSGAVFEPDRDTSLLFEEYAEVLRRAWSGEPVAYDGETYTIPPEGLEWDHDQEFSYYTRDGTDCSPENFVTLVEENQMEVAAMSTPPHPVQRPRPQLWQTTASKESAAKAAAAGMNVVTYCAEFDQLAELVTEYHTTSEAEGWPDRRPSLDGEPFGRGWDESRRRGVIAEVPVFNTDVGDDDALRTWKLGQECVLSARRSALPEEKAKKFPLDADVWIEGADAPIVGTADEIADRLVELREVCGYDDFAVIPSITLPGMPRQQRIDQYEAFVTDVAPKLDS